MSNVCIYFLKIQSGSDIVQYLREFTEKHNLGAAFVIYCVGEIRDAVVRLAEATAGFNPIREIVGPAQIRSLVGTLSSDGGHLHISLTDKQGQVLGGHVFGPLVASGTVEAVVGDCTHLSFARLPDLKTGYCELVVESRETLNRFTGNTPTTPPQCSNYQVAQQEYSSGNMTAQSAHGGSGVRVFALRLAPGEDIVESLKSLVREENLNAAFIMTCVGSVTNGKIRLAHDPAASPTNKIIDLEGHYEIVSLVGTLADEAHLHISLSDKDGHVIGGHVLDSLIVFTTAELVIGECSNYHMTREFDSRTGFQELSIKKT